MRSIRSLVSLRSGAGASPQVSSAKGSSAEARSASTTKLSREDTGDTTARQPSLPLPLPLPDHHRVMGDHELVEHRRSDGGGVVVGHAL